MSSIQKYLKSNWNVICDTCGRKRKRSEVTLSYGSGTIPVIIACIDGCADELQPLNYPPPVIFDGRPVPDARPDSTANNSEVFVKQTNPSYMTWFNLKNAGTWFQFNLPNNDFNLNGMWTWTNFKLN